MVLAFYLLHELEVIDKQKWSIYIIKYYSALTRNEILTYVIMWTNLEDIIQSKTSQTQKNKCCMVPLI